MTVVFDYGEVRFREVERGDLDKIRRLRNDVSTWTQLGDPTWLSSSAQESWIGSMSSGGRWYYVAENSDHDFIGLVRLDEWDKINQSIRVGADVAIDLRRQGFGTLIYKAIKSYCFWYLNCHRVWLMVLSTNQAARALYTSQGFREEGAMREAVFRGGQRVDYIVMSLLRSEWKE